MNNKHMNYDFWEDYETTIKRTLVPRLSIDTVRPYVKEDFEDFTNALEENIIYISTLLDIILQNEENWTMKTKNNLIKIIIIIGEQHCKNAWNNNEVLEIVKLLVPKICRIFEKENLLKIIEDDNLFVSILIFLRPRLMKHTWKSFPGALACYRWLLHLSEKPFLKRHISHVLPTALIVFDDYVQQNQLLGLECMSLIIEHCKNSNSLKNFNYAEVIFQALLKMAHKADNIIIVPLYKCIGSLLHNIQHSEDTINAFRWRKLDDILSILLNNMELQSDIESRYLYVLSLTNIVNHGSSGKWTVRLTRILSEYCVDDTEMKITNASLNLLSAYLSLYQPQRLHFYVAIYSSLLKLRYKLISSNKYTSEHIANIDKCILLLKNLCPNISKEIIANQKIQSIMNFI